MDPKDEKEISHPIITKLDREEEVIKHTEEKLSGMDFGALLQATSHKEQEKLLEKKLAEINLKGLAAPRAAHAMRPVRIILWLLIAGLTLTIAGDRMNNGRGVVKVPTISLPGESGFPAGGGCPQNVSKDTARLSHYLQVIQGYMDEVRKTIDGTGEGGKEYIAEGILSGNISVGDYVALPSGNPSPEYAAFRQVVDSYFDFDNTNAVLKITASGTLAYDDNYSHVFTYEKMGNSPYPLDYSEGTKSFARRVGKDEALAYANLLKARNREVCVALRTYLVQAEKFFVKRLVWEDTKKAPEELFTYAKKGAKFAYNATKAVREYKVAQAQAHYDRNHILYPLYETYYQSCYDSWIKVYAHHITSGKFSYAGWGEESHTGIVRTDWDVYAYKLAWTTNGWDSLHETMITNSGIADYYSWQGTTAGNYHIIENDTYEWRGGFDVGGIVALIREEFNALHGPNDEGVVGWPIPDDVAEDVFEQATAYYTQYNTSYDGFKKAQVALVKAVNDVVVQKTYNYYLPVAKLCSVGAEENIDVPPHTAMTRYTRLESSIRGFNDRVNSAPVPNAGKSLSQKFGQTPVTFTLQGSATDADKDPMNYRWVLTSIPDAGEAKSAAYVWYQPLSDAQAATLRPDLGGVWQATLEVNDFQDYAEASVNINAIRHILWISHSDKQTGTALVKNFYLETANESANVYKNFDDSGKPVDIDTYQSASDTIFCINTNGINGAKGCYDGTHGSTNLKINIINNATSSEVRHTSTGDFTLYSASNKKGDVTINVFGVEANITQLVLPSSDCPYGNKLPPYVFEGKYYIKQWVDNMIWLNHAGTGFRALNREACQAQGLETPDWMERRAAETLNGLEQVLPYVDSIGTTSNKDEYGHFARDGGKRIFINPEWDDIRYNDFAGNAYGFCSDAQLDSTAIHEAHHAFYFLSMGKKKWKDEDKDELPYDSAGGMFVYLFDTGEDNAHGAWGAKRPKVEGNAFPLDFIYKGDKQADTLREKEFMLQVPLADIELTPVRVTPLPSNIPISSIGFPTPALVVSADGKFLFDVIRRDTHFTCDIVYTNNGSGKIDKTSPLMKLRFDLAKIRAKIAATRPGVSTQGAIILVDYQPHFPHPVYEYDASSTCQAATYTGNWSKVAIYGD